MKNRECWSCQIFKVWVVKMSQWSVSESKKHFFTFFYSKQVFDVVKTGRNIVFCWGNQKLWSKTTGKCVKYRVLCLVEKRETSLRLWFRRLKYGSWTNYERCTLFRLSSNTLESTFWEVLLLVRPFLWLVFMATICVSLVHYRFVVGWLCREFCKIRWVQSY